jgi:hypothetical protein
MYFYKAVLGLAFHDVTTLGGINNTDRSEGGRRVIGWWFGDGKVVRIGGRVYSARGIDEGMVEAKGRCRRRVV